MPQAGEWSNRSSKIDLRVRQSFLLMNPINSRRLYFQDCFEPVDNAPAFKMFKTKAWNASKDLFRMGLIERYVTTPTQCIFFLVIIVSFCIPKFAHTVLVHKCWYDNNIDTII